jgi:hypothetical protein
MPHRFDIPPFHPHRGPLFWLRPKNWWVGRRRFLRTDFSNEWRYEFLREVATPPPPPGFPSDPHARTRSFSWLFNSNSPGRPGNDPKKGFSAVILGDTGEGDASQYTLLPLIRSLDPDFLIINGDVAYPAGNLDDYLAGFFEPYRDLGIPIWAVPGNHEYYSDGKGKEFFEVFCSTVRSRYWAEFGLALKPQPGSYWELAEAGIPLVIIGLDTGQAGALDGKRGFLGLFKREADAEQHQWLEWRLQVAQARRAKVVVLFHIPKLVDEKRNKVGLSRLHAILARYSCVELVVCAHIHNMQWYSAGTFASYLQDLTGQPPAANPDYVVSGSGGATIGSTRFGGNYQSLTVYPTPADFDSCATAGERLVATLHLDKTMAGDFLTGLSTVIGGVITGRAIRADADQMRLQSLLHLKCDSKGGIVVTPYYVHDLRSLYTSLPPNSIIQVQQGAPPLPAADCQSCQKTPQLTL